MNCLDEIDKARKQLKIIKLTKISQMPLIYVYYDENIYLLW